MGSAWYAPFGNASIAVAVCQRQFSLYLDVFFGFMKNTPRRKQRYRFRQGACCPAKDKAVGLVLPYVNMDMMQRHLSEISLHVADGCHAVVCFKTIGLF